MEPPGPYFLPFGTILEGKIMICIPSGRFFSRYFKVQNWSRKAYQGPKKLLRRDVTVLRSALLGVRLSTTSNATITRLRFSDFARSEGRVARNRAGENSGPYIASWTNRFWTRNVPKTTFASVPPCHRARFVAVSNFFVGTPPGMHA